MKTKTIRSAFVTLALATPILAVACGAPQADSGKEAVAQKKAALTVSTADVVLKVRAAAAQIQRATAELNDLVAGAYEVWPSRKEFESRQSFREFKNDLEALNAAALTAGAYAAGAYSSPILEIEDEQFVAGAYVKGLAAGAYSLKVTDKVYELNRE
jgi:hypothetical protein